LNMAILPIVTYNDPVLRKKTKPVSENSIELQELIDNMFETMYNSNGVGLAAPQVGRSVQLFITDTDEMTSEEEEEEEKHGPLVFINPVIDRLEGANVKYEEGCLSIPELRDEVARPEIVTVSYLDREFNSKKLTASGWMSRVIQHEYDHLKGILFIDHLSAFKRRLHKKKLQQIDQGRLETDYPLVPRV
jgi:peptide deformylase